MASRASDSWTVWASSKPTRDLCITNGCMCTGMGLTPFIYLFFKMHTWLWRAACSPTPSTQCCWGRTSSSLSKFSPAWNTIVIVGAPKSKQSIYVKQLAQPGSINPNQLTHVQRHSERERARLLPCGGMVALRRRGAAPAADEVLRRHRGQQQAELQHHGGPQLRHGRRQVAVEVRSAPTCQQRHVCGGGGRKGRLLQHQPGSTLTYGPSSGGTQQTQLKSHLRQR